LNKKKYGYDRLKLFLVVNFDVFKNITSTV